MRLETLPPQPTLSARAPPPGRSLAPSPFPDRAPSQIGDQMAAFIFLFPFFFFFPFLFYCNTKATIKKQS